MTAATLHGGDSSLASQCLALCQTLVSQGKAFTFSLKIDSTFSFSLDSKESLASAPLAEVLTRKKVSPSTKRRNARRRAEFLKKKQSSCVQLDVPSSGSASATSEQLVTSEKSHSSPAREADQLPPFELNGGVQPPGLSIATNAQMVAWTLMPYVLIPTSAPVIVALATTTGSTLVMILCGLFGNQIPLTATSSIALAPACLLLDVLVVGCGDLKSLCRLENPKGLF